MFRPRCLPIPTAAAAVLLALALAAPAAARASPAAAPVTGTPAGPDRLEAWIEARIEGGADDALLAAADLDFDDLSQRYDRRYAAEAGAGPAIAETRPLAATGRIYVNNVAGLVRVSTWDRDEVRLGGRLGSGAERLEISGDARDLSVVVRLPKNSRSSGDTVIDLQVPRRARIDLETVSADLVVTDAAGPVKVNTVSGDVAMSVASTELSVQTVSGDVKLKAPAARAARLNSVSGDLELEGFGGQLALETVSGNVELRRGGRYADLQLKSVSGDLDLDVALEPNARLSGQTLSGEITLVVPQALSGTALLKTFSGDAECEGARSVEHQGSRKREFTLGDGHGARIDLSSFSGDIRVERK